MVLHTVLISYNRLHLTRQAIESYLDTVTVSHRLVIVDNGSDTATRDWLSRHRPAETVYVQLGQNYYPGRACNIGFSLAFSQATHLHRADNDFVFLPGWCEHAAKLFDALPHLGQLGLRTDDEEARASTNVGGNMIVRREVWDAGVRYDERPWPEYSPGWSEDCYLSPAIVDAGWAWGRVTQPCIAPLADGSLDDPYYQESWGARHLLGTDGYE